MNSRNAANGLPILAAQCLAAECLADYSFASDSIGFDSRCDSICF